MGFLKDLSLSSPHFSLLFIMHRVCVFEEEKEAGEGMWAGVCVMQKASLKIAISLGGACEEKKNTQNDAFVFLGNFSIEMNVLAPFGQASLCLCTHTQRDQESTLRSCMRTEPSHAACLHGAVDSSAPTSLPA